MENKIENLIDPALMDWLQAQKHWFEQKALSIEHSQFMIEHCDKMIENYRKQKEANQAQMQIEEEAAQRQIKTMESYLSTNCADWSTAQKMAANDAFQEMKRFEAPKPRGWEVVDTSTTINRP